MSYYQTRPFTIKSILNLNKTQKSTGSNATTHQKQRKENVSNTASTNMRNWSTRPKFTSATLRELQRASKCTTIHSMPSSSSTALTPWTTLHQSCPSCLRTWENLSSSQAVRSLSHSGEATLFPTFSGPWSWRSTKSQRWWYTSTTFWSEETGVSRIQPKTWMHSSHQTLHL